MIKIIVTVISFMIMPIVNAATGGSDSLEVISSHVQKLLGTWKGDVIFNNEHRHWTLTKKRDYTVHFEFKVCDVDNLNCKEWTEDGAWNADEFFFIQFLMSMKSKRCNKTVFIAPCTKILNII